MLKKLKLRVDGIKVKLKVDKERSNFIDLYEVDDSATIEQWKQSVEEELKADKYEDGVVFIFDAHTIGIIWPASLQREQLLAVEAVIHDINTNGY